MPLPYVGIGASVGFDSEIKELSDWGRGEYDGTYNDDYCIRFLFKPSLLLRTPRLFSISSQDLDFHLFASPGIIMSPHASGAKNSGWLYWTGAVGVTAIADRFTISLGYSYSDFSLLDGNPRTHHGNYGDDRKHYTHSAFLTLGYKF